jgi:8-oxo-dGTP diphosphatase
MALLHRSCDDPAVTGAEITVRAGGALPWRVTDGALQLLLIHRDRYDDWSWPKGKLDDGETIPECAVREVFEEVGLNVTLGIPLPAILYQVSSGQKIVHYWAAHVAGQRPQPDGKEVDAYRWASAEEARKLLSNPSDIVPLDALEAAHEAGRLATVPFVVVRHAKAKPRSSWTQEEGKRPLAATGQRQALSVANLLECWQPRKIASSPWTRCVQTVSPYLKRHDLGVKLVSALTEDESERKPAKARKAIAKLLDKHTAMAVCTHRPVLPNALEVLSARMGSKLAKSLPKKDPYRRAGAMIVLPRPLDRPGKIVSVEVYESFED